MSISENKNIVICGDSFNSFYTSEIVHRIVYDKIIDKING